MKRLAWALCIIVGMLSLGAAAPLYSDHQDLLYYLDEAGQRHEVRSKEDWLKRREHILAAVQVVMGEVPAKDKTPLLDMKQEEEAAVGELTRLKISYGTDEKTRVKAYLFIPPLKTGQKAPAILCLHQTTAIGKMEPAGLGPKANLHYALHLAQRGYVILAPDYPSFGEYKYDFKDPAYASGSMKAICDNIRAVDLLQSLPQVDGERLGCIGHSLGGHNAIFTAVFEPRLKVIVSNCGFTSFPKYYGGKLAGWTSNRYMPRIASIYKNDPKLVPFDFPELIGALAPRAFLAIAPMRDDNFEHSGVDDCIVGARPIYELYGQRDRLLLEHPDCAHDFPEASRKIAYEFFDRHLK
ncbi:MAG TPA: alpha/beta fold hydrolase [Tepidisphaeraceae bacterium]|nr:alpha/beta fold hydrolase [Tepidisphaeraceae bacterium]